jgi:hypothetical protein
LIDELEEMGPVRMAGIIGDRFKIDPIDVLKSTYTDWAIRAAACRYVVKKEKAAAEAAKARQAAMKR